MHVYVIEHIASGRVYVGKANNVAKRWAGHLSDARNGRGRYLASAIRKYGEAAFRIKNQFSFGSETDAFHAEMLAVRSLQSNLPGKGFNLDSGGLGGNVMTPETRAKMSLSGTRRASTPEAKASVSAVHKGKKKTPEAIAKTAAANRGRKNTQESLDNMSRAQKGRVLSTAHKEAIASGNRGRVVSEDVRQKISNALKGRPRTLEDRAKMVAGHAARTERQAA